MTTDLTTVRAARPATPPLPSSHVADATLTGRLLALRDEEPLPGVGLSVYAQAKPGGAGGPRSTSYLVGRGRSDAQGHFRIALSYTRLPQWLACLLRCGDVAGLRLLTEFEGRRAKGHAVPVPTAADAALAAPAVGLIVRVAVRTAEVTEALRRQAGGAALAAGVSDVGSLARWLDTADASPAALALPERLALSRELEHALLDPEGLLAAAGPLPRWRVLATPAGQQQLRRALGPKAHEPAVAAALTTLARRVAQFDSPRALDWPLQTRSLDSGDWGRAVNAYPAAVVAGQFREVTTADLYGRLHQLFGIAGPRTRYRDYLVSVWQRMAGWTGYWDQQTPLKPAEALAQLNARYFQDFTTMNETATVANELVIGIVTAMLTGAAPIGKGLAAAAVPVRAGAAPRVYLDTLIAASGVGAEELGLRFRLDTGRDDTATSSPVDENIRALQGLFADSFQSQPDPFHTPPDVRNDTLIPTQQRGRAPFYLQYEEWLAAQQPFYPENFLSLQRLLDPQRLQSAFTSTGPDKPWYDASYAVIQAIAKAQADYAAGEYRIAMDGFDGALDATYKQLYASKTLKSFAANPALAARRAFKITDKQALQRFERYLLPSNISDNSAAYSQGSDDIALLALGLYGSYVYWLWKGDCLLALGQLSLAARAYKQLLPDVIIGAADNDRDAGYFDWWGDGAAILYQAGALPYTTDRSDTPMGPSKLEYDDQKYEGAGSVSLPTDPLFNAVRAQLHTVDRRVVQLRLGGVLLEWADSLYRADDPSSIARARELYKAALWLHGEDPGVSPHWPSDAPVFYLPWFNLARNPAVVSQTGRARLGMAKITAGLNYYGYADTVVPTLRFRSLKDSADRFAALAKEAERDYLGAMTAAEDLMLEELKASNLMKKAQAQTGIAQQQTQIAKFNTEQAQAQVVAVQAQIDAKRKELADKDSFLSQLGDFIGGMVKVVQGLPSSVKDGVASGASAVAAGDEASSAGLMGLGAGASVMAGYGLFVYAGVTSMTAMVDAHNSLAGQIKQLETQALPLAQAVVGIKQREEKIAAFAVQIAQADVSYAQDLLYFQNARLINAEFWGALSTVLRRVLRRYLELGAWSGWLAERALSFELAQPLKVIRMDYYPRALQGVTGSDLLQGDLAELEAARIAGTRLLVPFKHSYSLATDFPLAFGALKAGGTCTWATAEAALRAVYRGTFAHRVTQVSVEVRTLIAGKPARGMLINRGASLIAGDESLAAVPVLRFGDALPISEFSVSAPESRGIIPDDTLLPFEGSGLDTFWTIDLDRASASGHWDQVVDVIVSVAGRARYAESVRAALLAAPLPTTVAGHVLLSGQKFDAKGVADAAKPAVTKVSVRFDLTGLSLPANETGRKIVNLYIALVGAPALAGSASLVLKGSGTTLPIQIAGGYAMSNGEPLRQPGSVLPDSPLNGAIGQPVGQVVEVQWDKSANPGQDYSGIVDVVLGVEYAATPTA